MSESMGMGFAIVDSADIQSAEKAIIELQSQLSEIIDHATKDQWKNSHIEQMSDFYEINKKLEELGYGKGGIKSG